MALFNWDDKLKTNHPVIDTDHKKLVDLVNQLADAMQTGKGKEASGKVLNELIKYTTSHFATEERLMATHNYVNTRDHKAEHAKLVKEVLEFKAKYEAGSITLNSSLLNFLKNWLINHIMNSDKALANAIAGK